jgi:hypothetical protein
MVNPIRRPTGLASFANDPKVSVEVMVKNTIECWHRLSVRRPQGDTATNASATPLLKQTWLHYRLASTQVDVVAARLQARFQPNTV